MPQVTTYIRKDDMDKWQAIEKKSEFIHNALNKKPEPVGVYGQGLPEKVEPLIINNSKDVLKTTGSGLCKHGADPKYCKFAKNGKVCK
jgi:hypothetical protein